MSKEDTYGEINVPQLTTCNLFENVWIHQEFNLCTRKVLFISGISKTVNWTNICLSSVILARSGIWQIEAYLLDNFWKKANNK